MQNADFSTEFPLWQKGINYVAGIDEVGRGSWAGPLVAAGVIFEKNSKVPPGITDSKQLTPKKRKKFSTIIKKEALGFYITRISAKMVSKIGLSKSTHKLFRKIARNLNPEPDFCLIDAFYIKYFNRKKQLAIKHGDQISASIAAASIIAKVYRDELMIKLHKQFPDYGFNEHKGYGTKQHQEAIKKYGFTRLHRTSYNLSFLAT